MTVRRLLAITITLLLPASAPFAIARAGQVAEVTQYEPAPKGWWVVTTPPKWQPRFGPFDNEFDCDEAAQKINHDPGDCLNCGAEQSAQHLAALKIARCEQSDGSDRFRMPPTVAESADVSEPAPLETPAPRRDVKHHAKQKAAPDLPRYCYDYASRGLMTRMLGDGASEAEISIALSMFERTVRELQAGVDVGSAGEVFYGRLPVRYADGTPINISEMLELFARAIEPIRDPTKRAHAVWTVFGDYWLHADPALHAIAGCEPQKAMNDLGISKDRN